MSVICPRCARRPRRCRCAGRVRLLTECGSLSAIPKSKGTLESLRTSNFAKVAPLLPLGVILHYAIDALDGQIDPGRDSFNIEAVSTATSLSGTATPIYAQNTELGDVNRVVEPEGTKIGLYYTNIKST